MATKKKSKRTGAPSKPVPPINNPAVANGTKKGGKKKPGKAGKKGGGK